MSGAAYELSVSRLIDVPIDAVWTAFADHLAEWWCPRPWTTELIEADLRAGGRLALVMRGPEGEEAPQDGVVLAAMPRRRLTFTNALDADWRPRRAEPMAIVGCFEFAEEGGGTRYTASARHWSAEDRDKHAAMGFAEGWGAAAAQLDEVARRVAGGRPLPSSPRT